MATPSSAPAQKGHPRGLYLLFLTEMWERFSYYGMRAIFILFLTKALFLSDSDASYIYGNYTSLVYLTPLLGGYLCDRFLGNRRSILIGGIMMAIGQFLMFLSASFLEAKGLSGTLMWAGLTVLIMGNGFFKPNISTMVGQLYEEGDSRRDSAFTIFYMGINLGAFFAPLVTGGLSETGDIGDFKWGFLAACVGMVMGVILFEVYKNRYLHTSDGTPVGLPVAKMDLKNILYIVGSLGIIFFLLGFNSFLKTDFDIIWYLILGSMLVVPAIIISNKSLTGTEKSRIWVIFILAFFVIFFWSAFEQAGASLTIFADRNVDRTMNLSISKYTLSILIVVAMYALARAFTWFFEWKKSMVIIITAVTAVVVVILLAMGYINDIKLDEFKASWFQSVNPLAILLLAPVFSYFWGFLAKRKMEPASPLKMAYGLVLLCLGYVVIAFAVKDTDSSAKIAMWWLFALYILHTMGELCLSPIGLSMVSKLAPVRFASLLMGTWFLANAAANKLAGILSALIPPSAEDVASGKAHYSSILGFQLGTLYDFFIVFIIMSGVAAVILFLLSNVLKKMMYGIK